jgi:hypothetical protein
MKTLTMRFRRSRMVNMKQNELGKLEYSVLARDPVGDKIYAEVLERNEGSLQWRSLCECELDNAEEIAVALQWHADFRWEMQEEGNVVVVENETADPHAWA